MRIPVRVWGLVALMSVLAGCSPSTPAPPEPVPTPFQTCPAAPGPAPNANPPAPNPPAPNPPAPNPPAPDAQALPALTLPCLTGDAPVALAGLGRPAVINVWASYCGPCRTEMPALQAFADEMGERVVVLGVDTADRREAAAYAGEGFGISYPSVFDPDRQLLNALGRNAIPLTIFVDAHGVVRHLDQSGALTLPTLRALATEHLGVTT